MGKSVCVIGGGFGGLSAAALLAHEGFEVTLLEKNDSVGGRARVWEESGFVFDMGPSWYLMPEVFEHFFERLGKRREDYYELQRLDPYYRVFFGPEEHVDITSDLQQVEELFESFETGGARQLREYLKQSEYKYNVAMEHFLYREYRTLFQFFNGRIMTEGLKLNVFSSLDRFVRKFFSDRRARQILEYAMVFLGNSPSNAPALYSIMSHVDLNLGVWFPKGGMAALVSGLRTVAEEEGVRIVTGAPVRSIVTEQGNAQAVRTDQGDFACDLVLTNADYAHAELELLSKEHRSYSGRYWNSRVLAPTMFVIYLGLSRKLHTVAHHNLYFSDPWEEHFEAIFDRPRWPERPSYYVSCASFDDEGVAPEGHENVFFLVPVAPGLEDSDEIRERYAEKVLDHFERLTGENIRDHILIRRLYSHRDFSRDYNAFRGSALGLSHTLSQTAVFRPSHRSKRVKNLYYSGQYTHPGVGVPMTFISADVVTDEILKEYA